MFYGKKRLYDKTQPQLVYLVDTKEVLDSVGSLIDRCESVDEFMKKYIGNSYAIRKMSQDTTSDVEASYVSKTISKYRLKHK